MPDLGIGELIAGLALPALEGGAEGGGLLGGLLGAGEAAGGAGAGSAAELLGAAGTGAGEGLGAGLGSAAGGLGTAGAAAGDLGASALAGGAEGAAGGTEALFGLGDVGIPAGAAEAAGTAPASLTSPIAAGGVTSIGAPATPTIDIGALTASPAVTSVGPGAAAAGGAPAGAGGLDLTSLLKGLSWKDLLGPGVAAGGLGYQVLKGQQDLKSTGALKQQAADIGKQTSALTSAGQSEIEAGKARSAPLIDTGTQYTKYLAEGSLPPTMQAQLDQEAKDAKAAIVSRYASMGMPTDPTKNSTLQQEMADVDNRARIKASSLGKDLLSGGSSLIGAGAGLEGQSRATGQSLIGTGASLSGLETSLLTTLSGIDQKQTEQIGKAIASFAAALGTAGRGTGAKTPAGTFTFSPATT